jgi:hypothetical protein
VDGGDHRDDWQIRVRHQLPPHSRIAADAFQRLVPVALHKRDRVRGSRFGMANQERHRHIEAQVEAGAVMPVTRQCRNAFDQPSMTLRPVVVVVRPGADVGQAAPPTGSFPAFRNRSS